MQSTSRKRIVASCQPCYKKKQKCDRCKPCGHCAKRRRPEDCIYQGSQGPQESSTESQVPENFVAAEGQALEHVEGDEEPNRLPMIRRETWDSKAESEIDSLNEIYGYMHRSESNTMALVRKLNPTPYKHLDENREIPPDAYPEIQKTLQKFPDRSILDFLVQIYRTEVHWIDQIVHLQWFTHQYTHWHTHPTTLVNSLEFAILFLRICIYTSLFLPCPSYTLDSIRGMSLVDVRNACRDVAGELAEICQRLDGRGSVLRAEGLLFLGLEMQCEGRGGRAWEVLGEAVRVAQRVGLQRGRARFLELGDVEKDVRVKVYCSLYVWDSFLSRQLGCFPLLHADLTPEHLPRINLASDSEAPDEYTERLLQTHLAHFWRTLTLLQNPHYDATTLEQHYEKFIRDFLPQLPPAFAPNPSTKWDERLPKLPLQRQMLHVAIFDSVCHNFRSVLLLAPEQEQNLPSDQQIFVASQKRRLAAAALKMLECTVKLHGLLGNSHTRFVGVILPVFEAAVVLVSLSMDREFPDHEMQLLRTSVDPFGLDSTQVTRSRCYRAAQEALARLEMLAEVSNVAKTSARTLEGLLATMPDDMLEDCGLATLTETRPLV